MLTAIIAIHYTRKNNFSRDMSLSAKILACAEFLLEVAVIFSLLAVSMD